MRVHLRGRRPGDLGWACMRQGEIYAQEFGYSQVFEEYVVRSFAPYVERFDPRLDRDWVAELEGQRAGFVAVQHGPQGASAPLAAPLAQLRWFFVEPAARGQGVGKALLAEALRFCRDAGYAKVWLHTVDDLLVARGQYQRAGFQLVHAEERPCAWAPWGHEERWELVLDASLER